MWNHRRAKHLAKKTCGHTKSVSAMAGLERVVCETCGHVSLRYLHAVIQDDIEVRERESSTKAG
jgi:hypothetical protein